MSGFTNHQTEELPTGEVQNGSLKYLQLAAAVKELTPTSCADEFVVQNKDSIAAYFSALASRPEDNVSRMRLRTLLAVAPCLTSALPA